PPSRRRHRVSRTCKSCRHKKPTRLSEVGTALRGVSTLLGFEATPTRCPTSSALPYESQSGVTDCPNGASGGSRNGRYSSTSSPFRSIRSSSLSDGPLGRLAPISHWRTVEALVLSTLANTT